LRDSFSGPGGATAETDYSYEELYRLTEALTKSATASYKSCYQYHYDPVGNMTRDESTPSSEACTGNDLEGLYNAGNELECRMKGPAEGECSNNEKTEISGYTYNGAGEETTIKGYNDPASTGFAYNNLKQLESLTPPGKAEEKLKYLGSGQVKLTGLGTITLQNSALGITRQTSEGNASYYARTPDGTLIDERLPGSISYNPIYDAQGDVIGLLNSTGELVQTIRYGPYGENTNATKIGEHGVEYSPTNDPFLFQGGYHTAGGNPGVGNVPNGLYHFGERYYDPTTGRWTQPDPASGMTNFTFAGDDPINQIDPTGEMGMAGMETTAAQDEVKWCTAHPWNFYHEQAVYVRCEKAAQKANPGPDEFGEFAIKCAWGSGGYLGVAKVVDVVKVSVAGALATCALGVLAP
jgi:RHS repeat-associated protein